MNRKTLRSAVAAALITALMFVPSVGAVDSARRAIGNLMGLTDGDGSLMVVGVAAQGVSSARRAIANLMGKTDGSGNLYVTFASSSVLSGARLVATQGTLTADAQALSTTATWNNAAVTFTHWKAVITDTASAAGSLAVSIKGGVAGTTNLISVDKTGNLTAGNSIAVAPASQYYFGNRGYLSAPSDGVFTLNNNAGSDFSRLQFGGTTSSFPSLVRNGGNLEVRGADGVGLSNFSVSNMYAASAFRVGTLSSSSIFLSAAAPTIASGFGTSPSIVASNGTAAFTVNVGTGGTASAGVITMPAATTGWACQVENRTGVAANRANQRTLQTATTTTSVSIQNQTISTGAALAWTASDIVQLMCLAY